MFGLGLSTVFKNSLFFDPESLGSWQRDSVREVGVITGCFLLIGKQAWSRLKGFDERYFMYGEDTDLSMRARTLGYHPVICPEAVIMHKVGASSKTPTHKMILVYKGKVGLIQSHFTGINRKVALFFLKLGVVLRGAPGLLGSSNKWHDIWKRRSEWTSGYSDR
jgi:GT2 family glycosyltransferase